MHSQQLQFLLEYLEFSLRNKFSMEHLLSANSWCASNCPWGTVSAVILHSSTTILSMQMFARNFDFLAQSCITGDKNSKDMCAVLSANSSYNLYCVGRNGCREIDLEMDIIHSLLSSGEISR